ncbi:MAG: bifunctional alpha/beta hydrolase/OsmC family protein [Pseudomonadota bacterium]
MPTQKFTFPGHDRTQLAARLDLPDGPHLATALFAHCFTCTKDLLAARRIASRLASSGIAVLRFDFTGLGHSGGEFANTNFSTNVGDLIAAAEALAERDMAPSLLIGHSLGGAAVLRAAPRIKSSQAVVTIGAPFAPANVLKQFGDALPQITENGIAEVQLAGRPFRIGRSFVEDVAEQSLIGTIRTLNKALLVLHAPRDETVGIDNASRIFTEAKHPKSFVSLDDADHLLSDGDDADYAAEVIAAWAARYLDLPNPVPPPGAPEGIVRVSESDPKGFLQDIMSGPRHHLVADEPRTVGGTDRGLSPYGLLAAALGACTSMTVRMYARRKGWPLEHVSVDVSHDKVHAQDAGTASNQQIDTFTRALHFEGPLSPDQRDRLMEIANKCPVHRTLEQSARIKTKMRDDKATPVPAAAAAPDGHAHP